VASWKVEQQSSPGEMRIFYRLRSLNLVACTEPDRSMELYRKCYEDRKSVCCRFWRSSSRATHAARRGLRYFVFARSCPGPPPKRGHRTREKSVNWLSSRARWACFQMVPCDRSALLCRTGIVWRDRAAASRVPPQWGHATSRTVQCYCFSSRRALDETSAWAPGAASWACSRGDARCSAHDVVGRDCGAAGRIPAAFPRVISRGASRGR
jgi:hypothetical protein